MTKKGVTGRSVLVQVGDHFVDPTDIAAIVKEKRGLYVLRLKSQPNSEYPLWVEEKHISRLMEQFDIVEE